MVGVWVMPAAAGAAETADPVPMTKTLLILKVDAEEPLDVRSTFQERPPTITLNFPGQRVLGALPERFPITKGVLQAITARYEQASISGVASNRALRSLHIVLTAPYSFRVRSEPGRVVVEIDHPASIGSASVEVGLRGGTVIGGIGRAEISDRFRAMQEAMARAAATPWTFQMSSAPRDASAAGSIRSADAPEASAGIAQPVPPPAAGRDRKSTRLNSSH